MNTTQGSLPFFGLGLARAINEGKDCHVLMASVLRGETYDQTYAIYKRADEEMYRRKSDRMSIRAAGGKHDA